MDFSQYAAILLDLDGTIYREETALPGAVQLVEHLRSRGHLFACLSNSSSIPAELTLRLARMGMPMDADHIWTAAAATCEYVLQHFPVGGGRKPRVFNLATEGIHTLLDGRVEWVNAGEEPCDAVVAASPVSFYATMPRQVMALSLLRHGAKLVGLCADRVYPSPRGIEFGSGALNAMLAYAANVKPFFCGKPEPIFFTELCDRLKVPANRCVLIGDNIEADIAGAKSVAMATILTLTGVARREDILDENRPDLVVEDLNDLLKVVAPTNRPVSLA